MNVPWLALGTVYLLVGPALGTAVRAGLVFFSGFATGVLLATPIHGTIPTDTFPVGKDLFGVLPRALAAAAAGSARS